MKAALALLFLAASARAGSPAGRLLERVRIDPGLSAEQARAIRQSLARIAGTRTGGERARRFAAEGVVVEISTQAFGLAFMNDDGVLTPVGKAGNTDEAAFPPVVTLDPLVLSSTVSSRVLDNVLAHELLGHALFRVEKRRARVDGIANTFAEDEILASLVGDVVEGELGHVPLEDLDTRRMLKSTQAFETSQWFDGGATGLSIDESTAPASALMEHLAAIDAKEASARDKIARAIAWESDILHLESVHGAPKSRYRKQLSQVDDFVAQERDELKSLEAAREAVQGRLLLFASRDGLKLRRQLSSRRYRRFASGLVGQIVLLRQRLAALAASAPQAAKPAPDPNASPVWDEIDRAVKKDRKEHPGHWL